LITKFQKHALWYVFQLNQTATKKNSLSIYVFVDLRLFFLFNVILIFDFARQNLDGSNFDSNFDFARQNLDGAAIQILAH